MLGVHGPGRLRRETEEFGVELVDAIEQRRAPHIGRVRQRFLADSGRTKVLFGKRDDRFLALAQVVPELGQGVGAREPAGHADNRNRVVGQRVHSSV